jgi:hypothetical protein
MERHHQDCERGCEVTSDSIYHLERMGAAGKPIRLNLQAVRDLLDRYVDHFNDLTEADKKLLQRRFTCYCKNGSPDFSNGKEASKYEAEHPPSLDNIPNKIAVRLALKIVKGKGGKR